MLAQQINYWNYQETKRHNQASEQLESEKNAISREQVNVNWFTANEQQRHNVASEDISRGGLYETIRHNKATESISQGTLAESIRHNKQQEAIGYMNAAANTTQANAAMHRATTARKEYQLKEKKYPFETLLLGAQTSQANAAAANQNAQAVLNRAKTYQVQVDIAQVPLQNKLAVWDRINNALSNITPRMSIRSGSTTNSTNRTTNVGKAVQKAMSNSKGGKANGKRK